MKKRNFPRSLKHYAEYLFVVFFGMVFRIIPLTWVYSVIRIMGFIAFHILRVRRDVTLANLRTAFGNELSEKELNRIAEQSYFNMGLSFAETLLVPKFADNLLNIVDTSEISVAKRAYEQNRGLVIVSGHFGSWDFGGGAIVSCGITLTDVGQRQSNPYVDKIIHKHRTQMGLKNFSRKTAVKNLIKAIHNREGIALISDQDAGRKGVFVDFFGKKASTPIGAARITLKYKVPLIVLMVLRTRPGSCKLLFREVDVMQDDTIEKLTQRYTKVMEEIIRKYPEQYFWMHKRWKTQYLQSEVKRKAEN